MDKYALYFQEFENHILIIPIIPIMTPPLSLIYKYIFVSISHLGGPLNEEGVEAADVVFFSYID